MFVFSLYFCLFGAPVCFCHRPDKIIFIFFFLFFSLQQRKQANKWRKNNYLWRLRQSPDRADGVILSCPGHELWRPSHLSSASKTNSNKQLLGRAWRTSASSESHFPVAQSTSASGSSCSLSLACHTQAATVSAIGNFCTKN